MYLDSLTINDFGSLTIDVLSALSLSNEGWSRLGLDEFGGLTLDQFGDLPLGDSPPEPPFVFQNTKLFNRYNFSNTTLY